MLAESVSITSKVPSLSKSKLYRKPAAASIGEPTTGAVVTAAGLVFAATMASFVFADLRILGQIGTTIALGLLFDTLIVRSFMTPSVAALLGRWFWWPLKVRQRPVSQILQPYGSRHAVRQLLLWEDGDLAVSEAPPRP